MGAAIRWLLAATLVGGCGSDSDFVLEIRVHGVSEDVSATVDGATPTANGAFLVFERHYASYEEAQAAPLLTIETQENSIIIDSRPIGAGACAATCEASPDCVGLEGLQLLREEVPISVNGDGSFEGSVDDPRIWVGQGCMKCQYEEDEGLAVCT